MATFREDRNGEAEQRSLLRAEPGGAPQRRLRVSAGGAAGILSVTALVAVLGVPELFQSKSFGTESGSKELLVSKAIETPQLGGTLVPGPGCPVACGSFVQCATDRRSKNNLLPLTYTADLLGLAYDRSTGFVNLLPQATALIPPIRLANKQIVPRTPEFQCPNSTCWIPRAFLNDNFCDCPGCEDEEFHRCEDCGVGLPSFVDDVCPDRRCKLYGSGLTLNNLFYVTRQACLGTGLVTDPFTCPDPNGGISGCIINKSLVDDLRCDCPGTCADEADYTCENCSCPIFCGLPSRWSCDPSIGVFECPEVPPYPGRCAIPESRVNDGICDCPWTCADEEPRQSFRGQEFPVNCDVCRCPTACHQAYDFGGIRTSAPTCVQEQYSVQLPRFECPPPGNCTLPYNLVNDDVCDCPGTCADEEKWNCDTCMCPEVCGNRHRNCFDVFFQCPGTNCTISVFSLNDRHCDCPDCSDEEDWTCETCLAGCPTTKTCQSLWVYACESAGFACIFGSSECIFPWSAVSDNFCNCPFCEDEDAWDCSNCSSGCTGELCDFVLGNGLDYNRKNERGYTWQRRTNCFGEQLTPPDYSVQCPGYPANSGFPATQPGCTIPFTALNDNRCDCPTCRDESNEACGDGICSSSIFCSPGGVNSLVCPCPTSCGAPADCTGKCYGDPLLFGSGPPNFYPVEVPVGKGLLDCLYHCPGAECAKTVYILNDSVCDCINCEDEGSFSCETCTCPAAPLQRVEDFNSVGCGFTPVDAVLQGKGPLDGLPPWLGFRPTCVSLSPDGDVIFGAKAGGVHGSGGSFKQNLLQRAAPRVDLELNKVVHQALADEGVRKAVKSAEAEGYSAASLKAEMDALGSAIGFGPHHRRVYGLVHSFLAERDVQKTLENWVAEAYSEQAEDDVRQLVLKKAMTPRPPMWGSPILLHPPVRPSAAGALPAWPRRLQPPSYFANFPFLPQSNGFRGRGSVPCPGSDCFISFLQLNDRICDCPGCTDEDAFECDSCVPKVPFGPTVAATQSNLGVAVGVSLGVAVGVGLGVGLGVSAALGGVFSAVGVVQFTVANAQDFINNPQVQQGLKKAFLRLAGLAIAESAVTLNWACAGDVLAQINSKLRRLAEAVRLCFEIEIEGEEKSLDACEDLASTSSGTARRVINEELQNAAAASGSVQVVQWSANPNPLSKDPTRVAPSKTFAAPKAVAFDPGNLPPGLSTGPAAPAEPPPVKR